MTELSFDISNKTSVNLGAPTAPHEMTAILNLGCVDTQEWWLPNADDLFAAVDAGKLSLHLKFWNKIKEPLRNGNTANGYIDYQHPQAALDYIKAVFQAQADLRELLNEAVPAYLAKTYGVKPYANADEVATSVAKEVAATGVTSIPTLILDGKRYFDDQLVPLKALI